jgi:hypothetical protein
MRNKLTAQSGGLTTLHSVNSSPLQCTLRASRMPRTFLLHAVRESESESVSPWGSGLVGHEDNSYLKATYPCFYCTKLFESETGRSLHLGKAPACKAAHDATFAKRPTGLVKPLCKSTLGTEELHPERTSSTTRQVHFAPLDPSSDSREATPPTNSPTPKYPKPWVEEVEDEESSTHVPQSGWDEDRTVFVDFFPDPDAGAPISTSRTHKVDLHAYMQGCGALTDPDHFEAAELLMTTGLTNSARNRFLKSRFVSTSFNHNTYPQFC